MRASKDFGLLLICKTQLLPVELLDPVLGVGGAVESGRADQQDNQLCHVFVADLSEELLDDLDGLEREEAFFHFLLVLQEAAPHEHPADVDVHFPVLAVEAHLDGVALALGLALHAHGLPHQTLHLLVSACQLHALRLETLEQSLAFGLALLTEELKQHIVVGDLWRDAVLVAHKVEQALWDVADDIIAHVHTMGHAPVLLNDVVEGGP